MIVGGSCAGSLYLLAPSSMESNLALSSLDIPPLDSAVAKDPSSLLFQAKI